MNPDYEDEEVQKYLLQFCTQNSNKRFEFSSIKNIGTFITKKKFQFSRQKFESFQFLSMSFWLKLEICSSDGRWYKMTELGIYVEGLLKTVVRLLLLLQRRSKKWWQFRSHSFIPILGICHKSVYFCDFSWCCCHGDERNLTLKMALIFENNVEGGCKSASKTKCSVYQPNLSSRRQPNIIRKTDRN